MPSDLVTKDEIKVMIEVQSKNVEQMVIIAQNLHTIIDNQGKIIDRLYDGMPKDIAENLKESMSNKFESVEKGCGICSKDIKTIKGDVFWQKIILGGSALMFGIGLLINSAIHLWFHVPAGQP